MKISKCKSWKAIPTTKCTACDERCTNTLVLGFGTLSLQSKSFPVCNKHFNEWMDNKLDLKVEKEDF